ncbi:MAG: DUF938 domain-containing protein [Wenzhouxiangella sp.]|nr:DUF938 domain-containing protein [Wenzhouxiangella sp.]
MSELPFSPAAERNKEPIARALRHLLKANARVLEIGAGTGQHAIHFLSAMPGLSWQTSELPESLAQLAASLEREGGGRLPPPLALNVATGPWPQSRFDAVYTANTLHIMPFSLAPRLFEGASRVLDAGGRLLCYGPFMDNGIHSAPSNELFDRSLRARDSAMGVRDTCLLDELAGRFDFFRQGDLIMPANNRLLVYQHKDDQAALATDA